MGLRIHIVDDHQLFAEALASVAVGLNENTEVITFTQPKAALAATLHTPPDLSLIDLTMPELDGFGLLEQLLELAPLSSVIMISASLDASDMRLALEKGAVGYIPKSATAEVMLSAIKLVLAGGVYLPPEMLQLQRPNGHLNEDRQRALIPPLNIDLTPRQREVLQLLARGKSNKQIAHLLNCAETTVKVHVAAIFKALEVSNRTAAAYAAKRLGIC